MEGLGDYYINNDNYDDENIANSGYIDDEDYVYIPPLPNENWNHLRIGREEIHKKCNDCSRCGSRNIGYITEITRLFSNHDKLYDTRIMTFRCLGCGKEAISEPANGYNALKIIEQECFEIWNKINPNRRSKND